MFSTQASANVCVNTYVKRNILNVFMDVKTKCAMEQY